MSSNIDGQVAYEGYLWYSDRKSPEVYTTEHPLRKMPDWDDNDNPFVVEGYLYDAKRNCTCSVKYVDGHYIAKEEKVWECPDKCEVEDKYYQSNRMENRMLHFKEFWMPVSDSLCCDMPVLQLAKIMFVGFKKE